jgi:hypothetical protein
MTSALLVFIICLILHIVDSKSKNTLIKAQRDYIKSLEKYVTISKEEKKSVKKEKVEKMFFVNMN